MNNAYTPQPRRRVFGQRGALFSMDARIALIIASILAAVISVEAMQHIQRSRVETAEAGIQSLMDGLETYYRTVSITTFPANVTDFVADVVDSGIVTDSSLATDPWGHNWVYDTCSTTSTMEGVSVTVQYATLFSDGPDGVDDTSSAGNTLNPSTCASDFANFKPQNDDIGMKFNTLDIERERVEKSRTQLQQIIAALQTYETQMFMRNQTICQAMAAGSYGGAPQNRIPGCNYNGDATYDSGEEVKLNYFPKSTLDTSAAKYLVPNAGNTGGGAPNSNFSTDAQGKTTYNPTSATDMNTLMTLIGLSTDMSTDPWGRRLCYKSNVSLVDQGPYNVSVTYNNSCS